jgi:hypothetical protein
MIAQYSQHAGYKSKLDCARLFNTPTEAQKFDTESAATLIGSCTYADVVVMIGDYSRNAGLRRAIAFLAELSK